MFVVHVTVGQQDEVSGDLEFVHTNSSQITDLRLAPFWQRLMAATPSPASPCMGLPDVTWDRLRLPEIA